MSINTDELRALPPAEKLRLVELLWDDLGDSTASIPLPDWVDREAARRRDEMRDPMVGLEHDETWRRIERRNG
ncbi:MAG TPA: addiction module protein [Thermoguttaceae bacterium]|nr:addiction module protein [Thermoguttaceae bacterium]